jgi:hypothetical protein
LLCCLPVLLWKFIKEHLFTDIDDYYRRNLPVDKEPTSSSLNPVVSEAPDPGTAALPLPAQGSHQAMDRNREPSMLQHVRSRSDFTPGPSQLEGRWGRLPLRSRPHCILGQMHPAMSCPERWLWFCVWPLSCVAPVTCMTASTPLPCDPFDTSMTALTPLPYGHLGPFDPPGPCV